MRQYDTVISDDHEAGAQVEQMPPEYWLEAFRSGASVAVSIREDKDPFIKRMMLLMNAHTVSRALEVVLMDHPDHLTVPVLVSLLAVCTDPSLARIRERLMGLLAKASSGVPLVGAR